MSLDWSFVESDQRGSLSSFTVRKVFYDLDRNMYIAVDRSLQRHILLEFGGEDNEAVFATTARGLDVGTSEIELSVSGRAKFIDIHCVDIACHEILDLLARDLYLTLRNSPATASDLAVSGVIEKWKRFWASPAKPSLTREEMTGLFGELWFLYYWLSPVFGLDTAVKMWKGPLGARHDFEGLAFAVEVKSSLQTDAAYRISGLSQLEQPESGKLFFAAFKFYPDISAVNSLLELVNLIKIGVSGEGLMSFDELLLRYGWGAYDDIHAAEFSLQCGLSHVFEVDDHFPKLVQSMLVENVSPLVGGINYSITVNQSLNSYRGDKPEAFASMIRQLG
jgi:hypothetical protein